MLRLDGVLCLDAETDGVLCLDAGTGWHIVSGC